jgi:tetratricopeptide (TPR) repeat protein
VRTTTTNKGDDFFDAGQFDKAAAAYQQAIKLRPDYPEAHLNLGETLFNLGRYDEAIAADQKAIALKSNWAEAYRALGIAYLKTDKSREALEALKKAYELGAKDSETTGALSLAYYDEGVAAYNADKFAEAIADYQQAVNLTPNYAEAFDNLGDAYRRNE